MLQMRHPNGFHMDKLGGKEPLEVLLDGLTFINQPYWLSAGTLLGFEREGNFIPHDTDIDIAVMGIEEIKLSGEYKPIRLIEFADLPMQRAYIHEPTNIIFDIFHYHEEGDYLYNTQEKGTIKHLTKNILPLKTKRYLGHKFSVPNDTDAHLVEWYGDWRTPREGDKTQWS